MTLRSLLPLFLAFLLPTLSHGQADRLKVKVRVSPDADSKSELLPLRMVSTTESSLVILSTDLIGDDGAMDPTTSPKYRFDLYDTDKLEWVRSIDPVRKGPVGLVVIEDITMFAGRSIFIASQHRPSDKSFQLSWQEFDPRLVRNNPPAWEVAKVDYAKFTAGKAILGEAGASIGLRAELSPDGKMMLVHSAALRTSDGSDHFYMAVINDQMRPIWQEFISEEGMEGLELLDAVVDNAGTATAWVKGALANIEGKKDDPKFGCRMHRLGLAGRVDADIEIGKGLFVEDARMLVLDSGSVACAGVYGSTEEGVMRTPGAFMTLLTKGENLFAKTSLTEFPGAGPNGDGVREHMTVSGLDRGSDGVIHLICEENYTRDAVVESVIARNVNVTEQVHGDVVAMAFAESGASRWATAVPRLTRTISYLHGNVQSMLYKDRLVLLMLDDELNVDRRKNGEPIGEGVETKDSRTTVLMFDKEGGYDTKTVLDSGGDIYYLGGAGLLEQKSGLAYSLAQEDPSKGKFVPIEVEVSSDSR